MTASTSNPSGKKKNNPFMFSVYAISIIFTFIVVSLPEVICFKTAPKCRVSVVAV